MLKKLIVFFLSIGFTINALAKPLNTPNITVNNTSNSNISFGDSGIEVATPYEPGQISWDAIDRYCGQDNANCLIVLYANVPQTESHGVSIGAMYVDATQNTISYYYPNYQAPYKVVTNLPNPPYTMQISNYGK